VVESAFGSLAVVKAIEAEKEEQLVPAVDQLGEDDRAADRSGIVVRMPGRLERRVSYLIGERTIAGVAAANILG
jgi:hypothetical protein